MQPEVLFEDQHLLVISKPPGLLSQGEHTGSPNLVDWARTHVGRNYIGLVHRLDRNTSGAMVLAKRSKAADRLSRALQEGTLTRVYLAWVEGTLTDDVQWKHRLFKDQAHNHSVVVGPEDSRYSRAKEAVLRGHPNRKGVWRTSPVTLVEFTLETGRSHQIRAQAAFEGHPLLGDAKYGSKLEFPRPALHSHVIAFPHPMSGDPLQFTAPLPSDWPLLS